jgi:pyruvate, water dikinase
MKYIKRFKELSINDVALVGGKNASLGEMISQLSAKGIRIPDGFAITAEAYWYFINHNHLLDRLKKIMAQLTDINDLQTLHKVGSQMRSLIANGKMPKDLGHEIISAYKALSKEYNQDHIAVAVRSSATAEDLPGASFAGQHDTFLNVEGDDDLLEACKKCMASLFTDRAIIYRDDKGFDHFKVALSVGVQKMIRSDLASAGVMFTLDTETGFRDIVVINASFGLGEAVVQGLVNPDEFRIYKPKLEEGFRPIIKKLLGKKSVKVIYSNNPKDPVKKVATTKKEENSFSLTNDEILELAHSAIIVEKHYSERENKWVPQDLEWAKDGIDGHLYIVQSRPETVHASMNVDHLTHYQLKDTSHNALLNKIVVKGQSIGQQIGAGKAQVAANIKDIKSFQKGDILVTPMTDPDWVPLMKKAAAIVTDRGGRTSHAAIVSRELGIPAIVGTENASSVIKSGQQITVDCSQGSMGYVYEGIYAIETQKIDLGTLPQFPCELMINIADPDRAIALSFLPVEGVGLARIEFIFSTMIKIHPMAAMQPEKVKDKKVLEEIDHIVRAYNGPKDFIIDKLAESIGAIAGAFYPDTVTVRFSDFKTNEYRNLIGGKYFEPEEENPMLGLRGASRYYSPLYEPAFSLECAALKKVRDEMGFTNVKVMIPFVRTIKEAEKVIKLMATHNLEHKKNGLEIYMMCEVPSNVILIDEFCKLFDGISIGSNDLTQMTLAVDRDSELLASLFDERDQAVKRMMELAIEGAHRNKKRIGICGQAPSDYPEIADFLMKIGIDAISLNSDSVLPLLLHYKKSK